MASKKRYALFLMMTVTVLLFSLGIESVQHHPFLRTGKIGKFQCKENI